MSHLLVFNEIFVSTKMIASIDMKSATIKEINIELNATSKLSITIDELFSNAQISI